ncbi:MAG: NUDIX hydrolase [Bacteroidales bacterium]
MQDDKEKLQWMEWARKILSIAQSGLTYTENKYDIDRYQQLRQIGEEIFSKYTETNLDIVKGLFDKEKGYLTPKVDVRGIIFKDNRILMVQEGIDGRWTVPGGWADVHYSPFEIAAKEVEEEAGIIVKPVRLLAVLDKNRHPHPPDIFYTYKMFILCEHVSGEPKPGMETLDAGYFGLDEIPPLSEPRVTMNQLRLMFDFLKNPGKETVCD